MRKGLPVHIAFTAVLVASLAAARAPTGAAALVGQPAPDFSLDGLGNRKALQLGSLKGRVVLVDFWASWCAPCKRTLPELARLRARHPGVIILAVSIDEERAKAERFLTGQDSSLVALHDSKQKVAEAYDLKGMPAAVLIDKRGLLRYRHDGYLEKDLPALEKEVEGLMGENGP